ncbi:TonB-dependent receptor [Helicobacter sp. 11S02596-1]|uniref:TonB-dependent receptor n=1 Tax=Helicobacter sp. 11S02596-1 TaxID=1476194 RepID=UPI000BC586AC|nr:TonB-dependent receptor [Helicobacter sp. 11S02596-1]PAF43969.1 hypothetical protein BJI48_04075 [Helicobacter sp. 11S02596-1]
MKKKFLSGGLIFSLFFGINAYSKQANGGGAGETQSPIKSYKLQTQMVSANKFDQNLREVDGSVAVVSGKKLQELQIHSIAELTKAIPGLILENYSSAGALYTSVRGISNTDYFNPALVVYIDGIPQDPEFLSQELLNVKRVELLRGPQGTIWGQNAQSGVLNIITNPITSNTPRANASTSIGTLSTNTMLSTATPLLKDWLYIGADLGYYHQSGQITQKSTGEKLDTSDSLLGNVSLAFAPKNSGFEALFKYSLSDLNDHHNGFYLTDEEIKTLGRSKGFYNPNFFRPYFKRNAQTYALKLGYNFGISNLSNVFSYQDRSNRLDQLIGSVKEARETTTDELRLVSRYQNGAYSIFGAYFQHIAHDFPDKTSLVKTIDKDTFAIYGEGKSPEFWGFDMTLGARYSLDISKAHSLGMEKNNMILKPAFKDNNSSHIFTPKIAIGYNLGEDVRLYALYQNGYRAGGFDFITADKIKPEYTQNAELGVHSELFSSKLSLNAALYYIYITDKQVSLPSPAGFSIQNAGTIDSLGLELALHSRPIESLVVSFGGNFGHSRYVKGAIKGKDTRKNKTLLLAPDVSLNANIDWNFATINGAKFFANLNGRFYSKTYFDDENKLFQDPYGIFDLSLRLQAKNGLSINVYAQNLFNQKYKTWIQNFPIPPTASIQGSFIGQLRNIGASLNYNF